MVYQDRGTVSTGRPMRQPHSKSILTISPNRDIVSRLGTVRQSETYPMLAWLPSICDTGYQNGCVLVHSNHLGTDARWNRSQHVESQFQHHSAYMGLVCDGPFGIETIPPNSMR